MVDPFVGGTQLGPLTSLAAACSSPRNLLIDGRPPRSSRSPCSTPTFRDECGVERAENAIGGKPSLPPSCRRPGRFSNSCAASLAVVAPSFRSLPHGASTRPPLLDLPNAPPFITVVVVPELLPTSFRGDATKRALVELDIFALANSPNACALLLPFNDVVRRAVAASIDRNDRDRRRAPPPSSVLVVVVVVVIVVASSSPFASCAIPSVLSVASTFTLPSSSVGTARSAHELDAASSRAGALDAHPMASPSSSSDASTVDGRSLASPSFVIRRRSRRASSVTKRIARESSRDAHPPCTCTSFDTRRARTTR